MHKIKQLKNILYRLLDLMHIPERNIPHTIDGMIRKAIGEKRLLEFDYDECHRIIESHVYGNKNEKDGMMVYQVRGQSSSGVLGWKRMYLEKMTNMRILRERFPGKRLVTGKHSSWDLICLIVDE